MKKISMLLIPLLLTSCGKETNYIYFGVQRYDIINKFEVQDTLSNVSNVDAKVVLLFGQSNASGVSYNSELQRKYPEVYDRYNTAFNRVLINFISENGNNSSNSSFIPTTFGCGASSYHYGPELGIAKTLSEAYPDETLFIIKYAFGGSILDNQWMNGNYKPGVLYRAAKNFTNTSLNYLKTKGYNPTIEGICWMQGESDAVLTKHNRYLKNTEQFVKNLRNDFVNYSDETIYFIDAAIDKDVWAKADSVNSSKEQFASQSEYNILIDTNAMGLTTQEEPEGDIDIAHYDSMSMIKLGEAFGNAVIKK